MLIGRIALVTGSTSGLGLAIATYLAERGADIVLNGLVPEDEGQGLAQEISGKTSRRVIFDGTDLSDPSAIEGMMNRVGQNLGPPDILVNNAVVRHFGAIEQFSVADWERSVAVNINAAFHLIRLCLPSMKARSWGCRLPSQHGPRGSFRLASGEQ